MRTRSLTFVCLLIVYFACLGFALGRYSDSSSGSDSESGSSRLSRSFWDGVKNTYNKVEDWGKDHPVALAAIAVGASVLLGKRDETLDPVPEALDKACVDIDVDPNVDVTDVVAVGVAKAGVNNKEQLSEKEKEKLAGIATIVEYCKELKKIQ